MVVVQTNRCVERTMSPWTGWVSEVREVVWLASVVGGLSMLGVGMAMMLAIALDHWASLPVVVS
jgi:hypothetical protein